jgi:pimeloyl-ACP methyl ester carboxylesterase
VPDHVGKLRALVAADRRGDAVQYFMKDMVNVPSIFVWIMRAMVPMFTKLKAVAHMLPYDATVMRGFKIPTERAAAVRVPTLVIAGDKTQPRLIKAAGILAKTIPGAQYRALKGQTHNVDAKVLAPVVTEFLRWDLPAVSRPTLRLQQNVSC